MNASKPKKSVQEKVAARIEAAHEIAKALQICGTQGPVEHRPELHGLAVRIALCADPRNTWVTRLPEDGRPDHFYELAGRFWRCGSKLCPDCLARQAWHSRKKLRAALAAQKQRRGDRYYFVTMTIPNPGLSLLETRSIVQRAWSLFRKRSLCVSLIRGGSKSEEFTMTTKGFHYHLHCLWLAKWMLFNEVRRVWTDCVQQSFKDHERPFEVRTVDGMLQVKVKIVQPTENAVQEVCKYVTKSDSWEKLNKNDLREVALIRRWSRMFELFGSFALRNTSEASDEDTIVHTRSITDGGLEPSPRYWRDKIRRVGFTMWEYQLRRTFEFDLEDGRKRIQQQFPAAIIRTYDEIANCNSQ